MMRPCLTAATMPPDSDRDVSRPRILFIVDRAGWAHDRKTRCLQRELKDAFDVAWRYTADVSVDDIDEAAVVVVYYWLQIGTLPHVAPALRRSRHKLIMGICSHAELEGARRDEGLAAIRGLAHAVFVNNLMLYREFRGQFDCEVFYTPNGVDTRCFQPRPRVRSGDGLCVGWAGTLENHDPALRGFHEVIVPAVNVTPGSRLMTALREDRWRDAEEMREFYNTLDVYVCASHSEGTPNPCLEAAACGVPLVTTRVGNMPELVVDGVNGFFVERSVEDIAARLAFLRDHPDVREGMGRAARESIATWDWTVQAGNYRRMFEAVRAHATT
jgi:glycosyltransferase involved in cell wall biosynthesis